MLHYCFHSSLFHSVDQHGCSYKSEATWSYMHMFGHLLIKASITFFPMFTTVKYDIKYLCRG